MSHPFEGQLIRLRAVEPADWEHFYRWDTAYPDMARFTHEIAFPPTHEATREWVEDQSRQSGEHDRFRFSIETLAGEFVGTINTHTIDQRCGTFRYGLAILPEHQRKGYAAEAIRLLLRYYFHEKRYQKVNVDVASFNEPSIRLHESLGFVLEGCLRRVVYTEGQYHDSLIFGLTREEFDGIG